MLKFDEKSFIVNGKRRFFISGDFPFFRVPKKDLKRRLTMFFETGANAVSTYVPWEIIEREEGVFDFGGEQTDLEFFLQICREVGLKAIVRPGPYQYSEMACDGLPEWLLRHDEILAKNVDGATYCKTAVSYNHPYFLEKAEIYLKKVYEILVKYKDVVDCVQLDNEAVGVQIWHGSLDYNREGNGIGVKGGAYVRFITEKYGNIDALNAAYKTNFDCFEAVDPSVCDKAAGKWDFSHDYLEFNGLKVAGYLERLQKIMRNSGLDCTTCHNAADPFLLPLFYEASKSLDNCFIGFDDYYNLSPGWATIKPEQTMLIRTQRGADILRDYGYPASVLEFQSGNITPIIPMTETDVCNYALLHIATGAKGINYYIMSGGPNFVGTGATADVYDFSAPISANGRVRETFNGIKRINKFMRTHEWLVESERVYSVQIGCSLNLLRGDNGYPTNSDLITRNGFAVALACSRYASKFTLLSKLDQKKPLLLLGTHFRDEDAPFVREFAEKGGKIALFGTLPESLKSIFGDIGTKRYDGFNRRMTAWGKSLYNMVCNREITVCPKDYSVAVTGYNGEILGVEKGNLKYFSFTPNTVSFDQTEFFEKLLADFGAQPTVESSDRTVWTTLLRSDGKAGVFAINLYNREVETTITAYLDGTAHERDVKLKANSIAFIRI